MERLCILKNKNATEALCYKLEVHGIKSRWGGYFQFTYSFQLHCGPGVTHPLTEMSTRNILGGKGPPAHMADNLTAICEPIV